ncbi:TrmB family transcriptional regulator [Sneathia vaginalis]|uniref:TrmB family transcriptional regulator n=1 Tax=Sneathia vaginalis TaxID=187101 RepID=UPI00288ACFA1|nr:helix-turn-helix domain-containing protein [Sneathia vaginalis]
MSVKEKLMCIGFSEIEALIYIELLEKQGQNGTQLSKAMNQPRSTVYMGLESLLKKNIIYLIPTQTDKKNYNPIYPQDLVKRLKREYSYILETIGQDLDKMYNKEKYERVFNIEGLENIKEKIKDMVMEAKNKVVISGYTDIYFEDTSKIEHINTEDIEKLICIVDDEIALIANINDVYANAVYTRNSLIVKGIKC